MKHNNFCPVTKFLIFSCNSFVRKVPDLGENGDFFHSTQTHRGAPKFKIIFQGAEQFSWRDGKVKKHPRTIFKALFLFPQKVPDLGERTLYFYKKKSGDQFLYLRVTKINGLILSWGTWNVFLSKIRKYILIIAIFITHHILIDPNSWAIKEGKKIVVKINKKNPAKTILVRLICNCSICIR